MAGCRGCRVDHPQRRDVHAGLTAHRKNASGAYSAPALNTQPMATPAPSADAAAVRYPVHEQFHTWQGEGVHMGRSAYFIRTFGCPVKCPWCDSAGTWHPDHIPAKV